MVRSKQTNGADKKRYPGRKPGSKNHSVLLIWDIWRFCTENYTNPYTSAEQTAAWGKKHAVTVEQVESILQNNRRRYLPGYIVEKCGLAYDQVQAECFRSKKHHYRPGCRTEPAPIAALRKKVEKELQRKERAGSETADDLEMLATVTCACAD